MDIAVGEKKKQLTALAAVISLKQRSPNSAIGEKNVITNEHQKPEPQYSKVLFTKNEQLEHFPNLQLIK